MTTSRVRLLAVTAIVVMFVAACAAGANPDVSDAPSSAGFWLGLWHGVIAPVTFVISLFTDHVTIYEVRNTGNWYDFGFVLGLLVSFGGPARASAAVTGPEEQVRGTQVAPDAARRRRWRTGGSGTPEGEPNGPGQGG